LTTLGYPSRPHDFDLRDRLEETGQGSNHGAETNATALQQEPEAIYYVIHGFNLEERTVELRGFSTLGNIGSAQP
jgi:hypothetical protein